MYSVTEFFYDGAGNLVKPRGCFRDAKGELVNFGNFIGNFYDYKGYFRRPGDSFYDSKGNLVQAGGSFYDSRGYLRKHYFEVPLENNDNYDDDDYYYNPYHLGQ